MLSGLLKAICQMGIFMICAQTIVHFRPKASYEKYLRMLVSAMILIQLFLAIRGLFSQEAGTQLAERTQWFADSIEKVTLFTEEDYGFQILGEKPEGGTNGEEVIDEGTNGEAVMNEVTEITVEITTIAPIQIESGGKTE